MKITMIYNTVYAFATQRNATQRNATQRNAYHHYILNNNFKFYILQFFMAFNFLSVSFLSFIKESKSYYFFEWQKSKHAKCGQSSKTISFFVKKRNKKTTPFRIRNSLVKILSLRGDSRSNLFCVDCHAYARNDKFKIYNDNKNNFAILNLVKSFLTFITFDSLSRKIKNPCLVIKKLHQKEIFKMKILKTKKFFTYLVVGALVMALSISCKSNEEPSGPKAGTNPPAGEYSSISHTVSSPYTPYTNKATVTHNGNGCTISGTLRGNKLTGSTYEYKTNDFNITVNSWYENGEHGSDSGNAQGEQIVLNNPQGSLGYVQWYYTGSGNAVIEFRISADDGFFYNAAGTGSAGLTN